MRLSALHCRILRYKNKNLFHAPRGDAMILLLRQDDIISVSRFTNACLERVYTSAGPRMGDQASASPRLAGQDVMSLMLLPVQVAGTLRAA